MHQAHLEIQQDTVPKTYFVEKPIIKNTKSQMLVTGATGFWVKKLFNNCANKNILYGSKFGQKAKKKYITDCLWIFVMRLILLLVTYKPRRYRSFLSHINGKLVHCAANISLGKSLQELIISIFDHYNYVVI